MRKSSMPVIIGVVCYIAITWLSWSGTSLRRFTVADEKSSARNLVEKLVSPNEPPRLSDKGKPQRSPPPFPPNYDIGAQKGICNAINLLVASGQTDFPDLVAHLDDNRYSLTWNPYGSGCGNYSVSLVCYFILSEQIDVYQDCIIAVDGATLAVDLSYVYQHLSDKDNRDLWLAEHREQDLWKIQREAIQWLLASEKTFIANGDLQEGNVDAKMLRERIKSLEASHQPIPSKHKVTEDAHVEEESEDAD